MLKVYKEKRNGKLKRKGGENSNGTSKEQDVEPKGNKLEDDARVQIPRKKAWYVVKGRVGNWDLNKNWHNSNGFIKLNILKAKVISFAFLMSKCFCFDILAFANGPDVLPVI